MTRPDPAQRRFALLLMQLACRLIPPARSDWAQAMRAVLLLAILPSLGAAHLLHVSRSEHSAT